MPSSATTAATEQRRVAGFAWPVASACGRSLPVIRTQAPAGPGRATRFPPGQAQRRDFRPRPDCRYGEIAAELDSPDDVDALALTFAQRLAAMVDPNVIPRRPGPRGGIPARAG